MNIFLIDNFAIILINILGVGLALWVYMKKKREDLNLGFSLFIVCILSWISFYHVAFFVNNSDLSLVLFRLAGGFVFLFFISYYFFVIRWFLEKKGHCMITCKIVLVYGVCFSILTVFTDIIIVNSKFNDLGAFPIFSTFGSVSFYGYVIILTLLIISELWKDFKKSDEEKKVKILYFLIGIFLFTGLNFVFNVVLPLLFDKFEFYRIGNYSTILLIGFTGYAIIKQKLFGIKIILSHLFIILLIIFYITDIIVLTNDFTWQIIIIKGSVLTTIIIFSILLVRSVNAENKQKEKVERLAHRLELANHRLKELDSAKTTFLSVASHQLRTPLTIIKGATAMMIDGDYGRVSAKVKKTLNMVLLSANRLINLIEDLLDISRIELGRIKYIFDDTQLIDVVDSVVGELSDKLKERSLKLNYNRPIALKKIKIDAAKIREVIINLVENAIKYSYDKGNITLSLRKVNNSIEFCVFDTGIGINEKDMPQMFKKFSRTENALAHSNTHGTGLGLYVAKKILKDHKGEIWAESEGEEQGAKFCFRLPIK